MRSYIVCLQIHRLNIVVARLVKLEGFRVIGTSVLHEPRASEKPGKFRSEVQLEISTLFTVFFTSLLSVRSSFTT